MANIKVTVRAGIGSWMAEAEIELVACPHVGDDIAVGEDVVHCDSVLITAKGVDVQERRRFARADEAKELQAAWEVGSR